VRLGGELSSHVITLQKSSAIQKAESKIRQELYAKGHIAKYAFADIIGSSQSIREAIDNARNFASVTSNILIIGDTGTGKEMFAQSIHNESSRRDAPFVAINCAALSKALLESELFGYAEGAFTGAAKGGKPGIFEIAHTGTIFLDEISEIPLDLQGRLLRVLQERQIMRLGDDKIIPIDVRLVSATNKHLTGEVRAGKFRRDLYYRLNVLTLHLPSLNERGNDILSLAAAFIDEYCRAFGKKPVAISDKACAQLLRRPWDGNIRELRNVCECLVVLNKTGVVTDGDIERIVDDDIAPPGPIRKAGRARNGEFAEFHQERIRKALRDSAGDRAAAAERLGISKTTLWRRMKKYAISDSASE
jgi:transcriptional regulator with PAS, ATPase and Fis domain